MNTLPHTVARRLHSLVTDRLKPFSVLLNPDLRLETWSGDNDYYGFEDLKRGDKAWERFPFLVDLQLTQPLQLAFIDMNNGRSAHIDIVPDTEYSYLIFMDATEQRDRQRELQQKANELSLLTYRQQRLLKELRATRDDLAVKRRQAEEANLAKGRFISGMSHEFRTPLTSIMGYVDLLTQRPEAWEGALDYLAAIERGARHLLSLIENVLDQARLEADELVISRVPTDLAHLAQDLLLIFESLAAQKNLTFDLRLRGELPQSVELDNVRLRQILINLIGNALKFTDTGGVSLELGWHDNQLSALVADTGPGIPETDLQRIFEPFQTIDQTGHQGAGLGLTISTQLIELMGGKLSVSSTLGRGSIFKVKLPAKQLSESVFIAELKAPRTPSVSDKQKSHILLVEDNEDIIQLVALFLTDAGYELTVAKDGRQAVDLALQRRPDLIFMDMNLPVANGLIATRELRNAGFNRPIIALTASPSTADKQQALDAGCNEYLQKPIEMPRLLGITREFLQGNFHVV